MKMIPPLASLRQRVVMPRLNRPDVWLLIATAGLLGLGLVMVFNASYFFAQDSYGDPFLYFRKHLIALGVGVVALLAVSRVRLEWFERLAYPLFFGFAFLLVAGVDPRHRRQPRRRAPLDRYRAIQLPAVRVRQDGGGALSGALDRPQARAHGGVLDRCPAAPADRRAVHPLRRGAARFRDLSPRQAPNRAIVASTTPEPSSPNKPRISPRLTARFRPATTSRPLPSKTVRSRVSKATSPKTFAGGRRPALPALRSSGRRQRRASFGGKNAPLILPSRMMTIRSEISNTSARRCDTKMMATPRALSARMRSNSRLASRSVSAAVGSSRMSRRAFFDRARTISTSCWLGEVELADLDWPDRCRPRSPATRPWRAPAAAAGRSARSAPVRC